MRPAEPRANRIPSSDPDAVGLAVRLMRAGLDGVGRVNSTYSVSDGRLEAQLVLDQWDQDGSRLEASTDAADQLGPFRPPSVNRCRPQAGRAGGRSDS